MAGWLDMLPYRKKGYRIKAAKKQEIARAFSCFFVNEKPWYESSAYKHALK